MNGQKNMRDTVPIDRKLIEKSAEHVLETTRVPARHLLKVARALRTAHDEHGKDRASFREAMLKAAKSLQAHEELHTQRSEELTKHREDFKNLFEGQKAELERITTIKEGSPGKDGDPGEPGKDADEQSIIRAVLARIEIPEPIKGDPGKDAAFDEEKVFTKFVSLLQKNKLLDATHIKGLQGWVKDGTKYQFEQLMHGGGSKQFSTQAGTITGTVNGSNTVFTLPFASSNWKVYADGARQVSTGDYTIAGTTLTFVVAPISNVVCDS